MSLSAVLANIEWYPGTGNWPSGLVAGNGSVKPDLVLLLMVPVLAACAPVELPMRVGNEGLRPVDRPVLLQLLPNHDVKLVDPSLVADTPSGRRYFSDGNYVDLGSRGGRGVWRVERDRICRAPLRTPDTWRCEQLFADSRGRYFTLSNVSTGQDPPIYYQVSIIPVEQVPSEG